MTNLLNYRYRIIRPLGEGGFGQTFLAEDTHMPSLRRCVIKQLKPISSNLELAQLIKQRFAREAAVLEAVGKGHAQVPDLYAYFEEGERFYLVQEWIEGDALSELPSEIPGEIPGRADTAQPHWTEARVIDLLIGLLPALVHVHSQGIIHRDIKPDNIILRQADHLPCLIDFGAVKELMGVVIDSAGAQQSSIIIGTPGYVSPEQLAGRPTFASDLFSLGMSAIELLTGHEPHAMPEDRLTGQRLWRHLAPGNLASGNLASDSSDALTQILTRATHPYPQNRYTNAADMLAALVALKHPPATPQPSELSLAKTEAPSLNVPPLTDSLLNKSLDKTPNKEIFSPATSLSSKRIVASSLLVGAIVLIGLLLLIRSRQSKTQSVQFSEQPNSSQTNSPQATVAPDLATLEEQARTSNEPSAQLALAEAYMTQAAALYEEGREAQSLENLDKALAIDPDLLAALTLKGDIVANQTIPDLDAAVDLYTQVLSLDSNNLSVLSKRCETYVDLKEWALANSDCTKGLALDPQNVALYSQRGDILAAQEDVEGAIADYTQAIALNQAAGIPQKNGSFYFRRSKLHEKLGDFEGALADLNRVKNPSAP
jgi:serine/threonine protein kinase